jgi:hypothetical protein
MKADVRVIDAVKKAALSRLLLDSVVATAPGEKLDEKLTALALPADFVERASVTDFVTQHTFLTIPLVPPPSSDEGAWWDGPGKSLHLFSQLLVLIKTRSSQWRFPNCRRGSPESPLPRQSI